MSFNLKDGEKMKLKDILLNIPCHGGADLTVEISDIAYDSRKAGKNIMFVCLVGANTDGHKYVKSAYDKGSRVFLCENEVSLPDDAQIIICKDTRAALATASCNLFSHPYKDIDVIGITGTKGKTTVAHIVKCVLEKAGIKTGIIGTIGAGYGDVTLPTVNTTPESYELQKMFRLMADAGCKAVVMEVSSLGIKFHRTDGIEFAIGAFTNLYPDHIGTNEHETFEEYAYYKTQLFPMCKKAVVNIDDEFSTTVIKNCNGEVVTYGYDKKADYSLKETAKVQEGDSLGVSFFYENKKQNFSHTISMAGDINAHNALIAVAIADMYGIKKETVSAALKEVYVKGRCEIVKTGLDFTVIIDYAHNGVSLKSIIDTVSDYTHNRIIALYGSVGGRTQIRRQELGSVSGRMCDLSIITSDDPEFEDPQKIIEEIASFVKKEGGEYVMIADREEAVRYALSIAQKGDIIILAGKGHEEFMKIKGEKLPFSERKIILDAIKNR